VLYSREVNNVKLVLNVRHIILPIGVMCITCMVYIGSRQSKEEHDDDFVLGMVYFNSNLVLYLTVS